VLCAPDLVYHSLKMKQRILSVSVRTVQEERMREKRIRETVRSPIK